VLTPGRHPPPMSRSPLSASPRCCRLRVTAVPVAPARRDALPVVLVAVPAVTAQAPRRRGPQRPPPPPLGGAGGVPSAQSRAVVSAERAAADPAASGRCPRYRAGHHAAPLAATRGAASARSRSILSAIADCWRTTPFPIARNI